MAPRQRRQPLEKEVLRARAQAAPLAGNRQPSSRAEDPIGLREGVAWIGQVSERLAHRDKVEGLRAEHQPLRRHADELCVLALLRARN